MLVFTELYNPDVRGLTFSRRSHLREYIHNMHRKTSHNYSLMKKKFTYYSSSVDTLGTLNYPESQKLYGVMLGSDKLLTGVNLTRFQDTTLFEESVGAAKQVL
jgi:hypothetical protein